MLHSGSRTSIEKLFVNSFRANKNGIWSGEQCAAEINQKLRFVKHSYGN